MRKHYIPLLAAALASFSPFSVTAGDQPLMVPLNRLSMETALTIAQETIAACRKQGIQVGVTVVDRDGHPQVVLRDVLAPNLTLTISRQKAYAAVSFSVPTSQLVDRASTALGRVEGLVMAAGGVPIQVGGSVVGGVGVSGAPSGTTDEACAQAGVDAVAADLEMAI